MMKYLSDLNWWKQLGLNVGGVLTSILAFLGVLNVHYEWFTSNSINAVVAFILALGSLFVGSLATLINTYLTDKSKKKASQVASDYEAEIKAALDAEIEKIKVALAHLQAEQAAAQTTPSTEGAVAGTDTSVK
jgi:uncharacterized protein involved in cysteine biosynthesis